MPENLMWVASAPQPNQSILFVILHGLVTLIETKENFRAYLLTVDNDEHEYAGGTWLTEQVIPRGLEGRLDGVKTGSAHLDPSQNPVLRVDDPRLVTKPKPKPPAEAQPDDYGLLILPRPRKIHYFRRGYIKVPTRHERLVDKNVKLLSAVRVFEYEVPDKFKTKVGIKGWGSNWNRWNAADNKTEFKDNAVVATLHIFDAPGAGVPESHAAKEFKQSSQFLLGKDAKQLTRSRVNQVPEPDGALPGGLSGLELLGLDERDEIFAALRKYVRTGEEIPTDTSTGGGCSACCGGADGLYDGR